MPYKILALEPFYGGSHKAFLDGWQSHSRHQFTTFGLPDTFWRWRMRHSAFYFAQQLREQITQEANWDVIFCSDMLNLAEFIGLAPPELRNLPTIIFFHENQLAYPVHDAARRDSNAILANLFSALSASEVWFNSSHNRDTLLDGLPDFLARMPDHRPVEAINTVREKSVIMPLGIDFSSSERKLKSHSEPLHILWAARWEHDKNPEDFFKALRQVKTNGGKFTLSVIGESPSRPPKIFTEAKQEFKDHIINWGFMSSRAEYQRVLNDADVVVSTAIHEFFGLGILEAVAAGAYPLLPERLAYPEIFSDNNKPYEDFFYGQNADDLSRRIIELITHHKKGGNIFTECHVDPQIVAHQYSWSKSAAALDKQLEDVVLKHKV